MPGQDIIIYTDGAAKGNPGPGGYGIVLKYKDKRKEISEGFSRTTNNRMELLAVIVALESLKRADLKVRIYSDSRYVVDAVNKGWLWKWESARFKKKKNVDLWLRFIQIYRKYRSVEFTWVKGHADNPDNERCDALAVEASMKSDLPEDSGYEESNGLE